MQEDPPVEPGRPAPEVTEASPAHPWVHKHHLFLDPVVLLVVTALSVAASAFFGWQTWQVNKRQMQIQATQSLPLFEADQELIRDWSGEVVTDWLYIHNNGGLARNVTIDADPLLTLVVKNPLGDPIFIDDIPTQTYGLISGGYFGNLSDDRIQLGGEGNAAALRRQLNDVATALESVSDHTYAVGYVSWLLTISYQDYQGIDRTEYYRYEPAIDPYTEPYEFGENGSFMVVRSQNAQIQKSVAQRNFENRLSLPFGMNPKPFVEALFKELGLGVPSWGPVASPSATQASS